jgi:hypothetical protein
VTSLLGNQMSEIDVAGSCMDCTATGTQTGAYTPRLPSLALQNCQTHIEHARVSRLVLEKVLRNILGSFSRQILCFVHQVKELSRIPLVTNRTWKRRWRAGPRREHLLRICLQQRSGKRYSCKNAAMWITAGIVGTAAN